MGKHKTSIVRGNIGAFSSTRPVSPHCRSHILRRCSTTHPLPTLFWTCCQDRFPHLPQALLHHLHQQRHCNLFHQHPQMTVFSSSTSSRCAWFEKSSTLSTITTSVMMTLRGSTFSSDAMACRTIWRGSQALRKWSTRVNTPTLCRG